MILRISLLSKPDLLVNGEKVFGEHAVNLYLTLYSADDKLSLVSAGLGPCFSTKGLQFDR